jgi:hypothetical protein
MVDVTHKGSCHCGAIAVEVDAPADLEAHECNCSMCRRTGFLHLIVPKSRFRLLQGMQAQTTYTFGTGVAQHCFCRHCGTRPYYVPRSNPDGYSVNVRCLDPETVKSLKVLPFDGQNWEANPSLGHLSLEPGTPDKETAG